MGLRVASLNSGSNGNCYYIGNNTDAVLIDAGISCRETERRLKRLELSIKKVKGIFITHEHNDHILGLHKLCKRHQLPVYITQATRKNFSLEWDEGIAIDFAAYRPISVGTLTVTALPKFHDAADAHSFLVSDGAVTVGVFTDMGRVCPDLIKNFSQCHAAILESNYDEEMLETGAYPLPLKNRIRGGWGHISNRQALQLFMQHRPVFMTHLFLAHLSKNNNRPELVEELFGRVAGHTKIMVASRHQESEIAYVEGATSPAKTGLTQLSLFGN
ncbi:MAG: MBL fold metallo-hydrolase [Cyclobacteriaceae bacterium]|jgi:phosphoribosyl 1,2-cyclic phosphodiesterase|nr:MBL fold metallo-hydrolase [Cyclobacteriaceae bacterium]